MFKVKFLAYILLFLPMAAFCMSADCEVFFSPQDELANRLIELIDKEKKSIKVAVYSMTHVGIAKALDRAKQRGVQIEVLVDPNSVKFRSSIKKLVEAKIPVFVWDRHLRLGEGKKKSLLHDKFCIFGDTAVWTGSFDFTNLRNHENAINIQSGEVAKSYLAQFSKMVLYESRPYQEFLAIYPKKKREKNKETSYPSAVGGKNDHSTAAL